MTETVNKTIINLMNKKASLLKDIEQLEHENAQLVARLNNSSEPDARSTGVCLNITPVEIKGLNSETIVSKLTDAMASSRIIQETRADLVLDNPKHLVLGKYELGKQLGAGVCGATYSATNVSTGTRCAIKIEKVLESDTKSSGMSSIWREQHVYDFASRLSGPERDLFVQQREMAFVTSSHKHHVEQHKYALSRGRARFAALNESSVALVRVLDLKDGVLSDILPTHSQTRRMVHQISQALGILRKTRLAHLDVHAGNIAFVRQGDHLNFSLIDYGMALGDSKEFVLDEHEKRLFATRYDQNDDMFALVHTAANSTALAGAETKQPGVDDFTKNVTGTLLERIKQNVKEALSKSDHTPDQFLSHALLFLAIYDHGLWKKLHGVPDDADVPLLLGSADMHFLATHYRDNAKIIDYFKEGRAAALP